MKNSKVPRTYSPARDQARPGAGAEASPGSLRCKPRRQSLLRQSLRSVHGPARQLCGTRWTRRRVATARLVQPGPIPHRLEARISASSGNGNEEPIRILPIIGDERAACTRSNDFTILAFKLLALKAGYTYELTWFYR